MADCPWACPSTLRSLAPQPQKDPNPAQLTLHASDWSRPRRAMSHVGTIIPSPELLWRAVERYPRHASGHLAVCGPGPICASSPLARCALPFPQAEALPRSHSPFPSPSPFPPTPHCILPKPGLSYWASVSIYKQNCSPPRTKLEILPLQFSKIITIMANRC